LSIPPLLNEETIYEFMESTMEKRLTMKEVQDLFKISRATLRKWIKYENLPIIYVSDKKRYVLEKDLKCWEELKKLKKE
jgi:predicted site-specific integrase-resolvase